MVVIWWTTIWWTTSEEMRMIGKMRTTDLSGETFHASSQGRLLWMQAEIHSSPWFTPTVFIAYQLYGMHVKATVMTEIFNYWINICTWPAMIESDCFHVCCFG